MKTTLSFLIAAVVAGVLGGVAVGYWEARPWAAGAATPLTSPREPGDAHDHATDGAAVNANAPLIVAPETTFHFGNMESGSTQRHEFPVRNPGDGPVTVHYVSHTCKCTEVRLDGKLIEPGASFVVAPRSEASIMLEWAAKVDPGPFRHGASFTTNDRKLSRIELTVEGEIVESATLEPSILSFGSVHVGQPGRAELVVMSFLDPKVEILSYEVLDKKLAERMQVSFEPVPADQLPNKNAKAGVKVVATYDPGDTLGPFGGSLRLETNLKESPRREVAVIGAVKGDIWIYSNAWNDEAGVLRMVPVSSAKGGSTRVFVNIRGEHAATTKLSVDSVTPGELKASLGEPETMREGLVRVPLTVEIPAGTRPMVRAGDDQGGEGEIILATTHPNTSKVRLRVFFSVQP